MTDPILTDHDPGHKPYPRRRAQHHLDRTSAIPVVHLLDPNRPTATAAPSAPSVADRIRASLAPLTSHDGFRRFLGGMAISAGIALLLVAMLVLRVVAR